MVISYFLSIIARVLALTDKILSAWVGTPVLVDLSPYTNCTSYILNVQTTTCGDKLVTQIQQLVFNGVGLLNGVLVALAASSPTQIANAISRGL